MNLPAMAEKTSGMPGHINQDTISRGRGVTVSLYSALVRLNTVEHCAQFWPLPHTEKKLDWLVRVYRRAGKKTKGLGNLPYGKRIGKLGFSALDKDV